MPHVRHSGASAVRPWWDSSTSVELCVPGEGAAGGAGGALAVAVDPEVRAQSAPVASLPAARAEPAAGAPPAAPATPPPGTHSSTELLESHQGRTADAPLCLTCGTKMRPAGSCYVCEGCGSTSGCS